MSDIMHRGATNYQLSIAVDYTAQLLELLMCTQNSFYQTPDLLSFLR